MQSRDYLQYIFNLFLNMLKSASILANLMGAEPPIDQPPLNVTIQYLSYFINKSHGAVLTPVSVLLIFIYVHNVNSDLSLSLVSEVCVCEHQLSSALNTLLEQFQCWHTTMMFFLWVEISGDRKI